MADIMRPTSFLPSITCSTCGKDIEISELADHVCGSSQPDTAASNPISTTWVPQLKGNQSLMPNQPTYKAYSRPGKAAPPRIDPSAANRPFLGQKQDPLSSGGSRYSRSPSPLASRDQARSPRSATRSKNIPAGRSHGPPSPDLNSNMDCAFPPFPTSRSGTPDSTVASSKYGTRNPYAGPDPIYSPIDAKPMNSPSVLQRMNTIAPGPFDGRAREEQQDPKSPGIGRSSTHRRTATASSVRESLRSISSGKRGHGRQASLATSERSRSPIPPFSFLNNPIEPMSGNMSESYRKPPARPVRPKESVDWDLHNMKQETMDPAIQNISQGTRSRTFPMRKDSEDDTGFQGSTHARKQSAPIPHSRRPSLPSNPKAPTEAPITPRSARNMDRPKKSNMFEPAGTLRSRSGSQSSTRTDVRHANAPPVPFPPTSQQPLRIQPNNLRSRDSSSSSGSDGRRDGSRSTPPTSASSSMSSTASSAEFFGKPSSLPSRPSTRDGKTGMPPPPPPFSSGQQFQSMNAFAGPSAPSSNMNRSNPPRPIEISGSSPIIEGPESPMDPAIQMGLFSPPKSTKSSKPPRAAPQLDSKPLPAAPQLRSDPPSIQRRPTTKGNCRGCGELITGKSIKAADGRLTGRYHKQCFVCQTCKYPFATASFYVFEDQPYCEHDYHTLNGSVCHSCNRGIEGQYLDTETRQKFHPKCFTCNKCRVVLSQDYFEVGNGVFCERHAFSQVPGPGAFLGAGMGMGKKNPERRTTRLMMM